MRLSRKHELSMKLSQKPELSKSCRESLYMLWMSLGLWKKLSDPANKIILLWFCQKKILGPDQKPKPPECQMDRALHSTGLMNFIFRPCNTTYTVRYWWISYFDHVTELDFSGRSFNFVDLHEKSKQVIPATWKWDFFFVVHFKEIQSDKGFQFEKKKPIDLFIRKFSNNHLTWKSSICPYSVNVI